MYRVRNDSLQKIEKSVGSFLSNAMKVFMAWGSKVRSKVLMGSRRGREEKGV